MVEDQANMWSALESDILTRLPRQGSNGSPRNGEPSSASAREHEARWRQRLAELHALGDLHDDWDGQGASAPLPELVTSALALAEQLRQERIDAPCRVVAGVNGSVILEWQTPKGAYTEIEVTAPHQADGYSVVPGEQTLHWSITEPV
jgi:hypothetical protein